MTTNNTFLMHHVHSSNDVSITIDIKWGSSFDDLPLMDIDDIIEALKSTTKFYEELFERRARETAPDWL